MLEGRHTDEEIADTDVQQLTLTLTLTLTLNPNPNPDPSPNPNPNQVQQLRDFTLEGEEQRKRRIAQHSLFVQVDGPNLNPNPHLTLTEP